MTISNNSNNELNKDKIASKKKYKKMAYRFNGFLPIVVDVETGGSNSNTDALLEIAAFLIERDEEGLFSVGEMYHCHVKPFEGANLNPEALEVNRIDPYHPFRFAIDEEKALEELYAFVNKALETQQCRRAILVGHNAHFDLSFLQAAAKRVKVRHKDPFHRYTVFDTATLAGYIYGKTVLAKAMRSARIPFDRDQAHSAIYDAEKTAILFCKILNLWKL